MNVVLILFLIASGINGSKKDSEKTGPEVNDSILHAKELVRDGMKLPAYNGSEFAAPTYLHNATCKFINAAQRFVFAIKKECPVTYNMAEVDGFLYDTEGVIRYRCHKYRPIEFIVNQVYMLGTNQLLNLLNAPPKDSYKRNWCMLTFFYSPKCIFSEKFAPAFNAIPFNYPTIVAVAVDATQFSRLNTRYGIAGTPNLLFWVNGIPISRMDDRPLTAAGMMDFLNEWTDVESLRISEKEDYPLTINYDPNQGWWETPAAGLILFLAALYQHRSWLFRQAPISNIFRHLGTNSEAVTAFFNGM